MSATPKTILHILITNRKHTYIYISCPNPPLTLTTSTPYLHKSALDPLLSVPGPALRLFHQEPPRPGLPGASTLSPGLLLLSFQLPLLLGLPLPSAGTARYPPNPLPTTTLPRASPPPTTPDTERRHCGPRPRSAAMKLTGRPGLEIGLLGPCEGSEEGVRVVRSQSDSSVALM